MATCLCVFLDISCLGGLSVVDMVVNQLPGIAAPHWFYDDAAAASSCLPWRKRDIGKSALLSGMRTTSKYAEREIYRYKVDPRKVSSHRARPKAGVYFLRQLLSQSKRTMLKLRPRVCGIKERV